MSDCVRDRICVRENVCVWERERGVNLCESKSMWDWDYVCLRESMYECVRERERGFVYVY